MKHLLLITVYIVALITELITQQSAIQINKKQFSDTMNEPYQVEYLISED